MAGRYDRQALGRYGKSYEETVAIAGKYLKPMDTLLDYACGTGITSIPIAAAVRRVVAIDLSDKMIRIAREKAKCSGIENITFKTTTIEDPDLINDAFDVITAFNILHGLKEVETVLLRIRTLLKEGGFLLSVTDCLGEKKSLAGILYTFLSKIAIIPHVNLFKRNDLTEIITAAGFSVIEEKQLYPSPPNYFIAAVKIADK